MPRTIHASLIRRSSGVLIASRPLSGENLTYTPLCGAQSSYTPLSHVLLTYTPRSRLLLTYTALLAEVWAILHQDPPKWHEISQNLAVGSCSSRGLWTRNWPLYNILGFQPAHYKSTEKRNLQVLSKRPLAASKGRRWPLGLLFCIFSRFEGWTRVFQIRRDEEYPETLKGTKRIFEELTFFEVPVKYAFL
jgi:hypothetical protein